MLPDEVLKGHDFLSRILVDLQQVGGRPFLRQRLGQTHILQRFVGVVLEQGLGVVARGSAEGGHVRIFVKQVVEF